MATLTDPSPDDDIGDFRHTISWGDGTTDSAGTVSFDATTMTDPVKGKHAFAEEETYGGSVKGSDEGTSATAKLTATIADATGRQGQGRRRHRGPGHWRHHRALSDADGHILILILILIPKVRKAPP